MSDPTEDTAAAAMPAPTFKRKKRPAQARSVDPKPLADSALQDADDDHRDSTRCVLASSLESARLTWADSPSCEPRSETLDELLALRRLKRSTAGLELDRLNSGERRKRAKAAPSAAAGEQGAEGYVLREDGTVEGTQGGLRGGSGGAAAAGQDRLRDDAESHDARQRKIIKTDNFTGQTNTVDVDKHMCALLSRSSKLRRADLSSAPATQACLHRRRARQAARPLFRVRFEWSSRGSEQQAARPSRRAVRRRRQIQVCRHCRARRGQEGARRGRGQRDAQCEHAHGHPRGRPRHRVRPARSHGFVRAGRHN